jgi:hypothetical protein
MYIYLSRFTSVASGVATKRRAALFIEINEIRICLYEHYRAFALAKAGTTIILSAGTCDDDFTIDKCVNIRGASAGNSAATYVIITRTGLLRLTETCRSGAVELKGFTIRRGLVLESDKVQTTVNRCSIRNPRSCHMFDTMLQ